MDEERLEKFKNLSDWKTYYENLYKKTNKEIYKKKSLEFVNKMAKTIGSRFDSKLNLQDWLEERKKFEEIMKEDDFFKTNPYEKEEILKILKRDFDRDKLEHSSTKIEDRPYNLADDL